MKQSEIIICMENAIVALDLERLIKKTGFRNIYVCYSYEEVYEKLGAIAPKLLVLDIPFGKEDECLKLIRDFKKCSASPVVVITSSNCSRFCRLIKEAGAVSIHFKPLDREYFHKSLCEILVPQK